MSTSARELRPSARQGAGRVTLAGAGPGDAELLTLKTIKALQSADVILFDALVSDEVLAFAKVSAKRLLVGKRGHMPSCRQEDINAMMIKLARQGKHVVRLKAGDPSIFGRSGEEIEFLEREGIEVAIIPGVTSASAMAAALGISLTHRNHAQSVRFVTGHSREGALPVRLDWQGLADPATTLIVYMGARTSASFARRLMMHGLSDTTPAAAVASVSRADESRWTGTLGALARGKCDEIFASSGPVLIGIGQTFAAASAHMIENVELASARACGR